MGDSALGQWEEWTGRAYHVRRRLTAEEQALVGEALDIRGTPEQEKRYQAVRKYLPIQYRHWKE